MKKFLNLILIAFIANPVILLADNPMEFSDIRSINNYESFERNQNYKAVALSREASPLFNSIKVNIKPDVQFLENSTPIYDLSKILHGQNWEMGQVDNYNFTYEPYSQTLFAVSCSRTGKGKDDKEMQEDDVRKSGYLWYTVKEEGKPLGSNWVSTKLYDSIQPQSSTTRDLHEWFYPTIAATNPKKSNKFEDVHIGFNCTFFEYPYSDPNRRYERKKWFIYTNGQNILNSVAAVEYNDTEPGLHNDNGLVFAHGGSLKGYGATINGKPYALFITRAIDKNNSEAPQNYAFVGLDLSASKVSACLNKTQLLPPSIMNNIFDDAIMTPKNFLSVPSAVDYDENCNVYFAFCNPTRTRYTNPEGYENWKTMGIPLVVKAPYNDAKGQEIDFGTTPNVNQIPQQIILDYMVAHGGLPDTTDRETAPMFRLGGLGRWDMQFCVIDEDNYAFLLPLVFAIDNKKSEAIHLVEVAYNKTKWSIRKISDINYMPIVDDNKTMYVSPPFSYIQRRYNGKNELFLRQSLTFYENQISRTADNKYFVSKWINCAPEYMKPVDGAPIVVYMARGCGAPLKITLDSIPFAKMFLSYRHVDSNTWSTPVEACDIDTISMAKTLMPKIVPSITEIPITFWVASPQFISFPMQEKTHPVIRNSFETYAYNWLVMANAKTGFVKGIEEGEAADVYSLGNAYPNPSTSIINFEFSLLAPSHTTLTVTNSLGQAVATVVDQFCNASDYKAEFNTSKLPTGTYYYTLKSGARVETKMFNVIR